jgi:hypothetical protein
MKEKKVTLKLSHESDSKNAHELRAYVVNAEGSVIETASFDGSEAQLKISKEQLHAKNKIYIGQAIPKEAGRINENLLLKAKAFQVLLNFENDINISIAKLPSAVLIPFPWHLCHVTGNLGKNFIIDGKVTNLPVCHARVHVCDVERLILWPPIYYPPKIHIPDWVYEELRNKFSNLGTFLPKFPPRPGPDPAPYQATGFVKRNLPLSDLVTPRDVLQKNILNSGLQPLPDHVFNKITSESVQTIKEALIDHHELLYPYICLWPIFWPWFYWLEEEIVVTSDCNGHFDAWLFSLNNVNRNIYIWVEVEINGSWVTVYRPPIPCFTYWNYACGTNINIVITDPNVQPCNCGGDGPADAVWFRSIGSGASALHIEQNTSSTIALQGASLKNGGCTDILYGQNISPFGSSLVLKLFCGANIFNAGVTHYRWKATRIADENQNIIPLGLQTTKILSGNITRPYLVKLSTVHYETHTATLGAEGIGTDIAYRIPHQNIVAETLIPASDHLLSPEWSDIFFDSASVDSHSLGNGIHKFELELLKQEADGSFTLVPVSKSTFQVSEYSNINNSQDAPNGYLNINSNPAKANSFKMNVRVDNDVCVADIQDALLIENPGQPRTCGFIKYNNTTDHVQLSFIASHPRNFADFSFNVIKGNNTENTGIHPFGYVLSGAGGFILAGGIFYGNVTVAQLLGSCPRQAAFSENLYVAALATDGNRRLSEYDRSDVNAFATSDL